MIEVMLPGIAFLETKKVPHAYLIVALRPHALIFTATWRRCRYAISVCTVRKKHHCFFC